MEMKPGYKQTEVGVIPEEWEVPTISQVFQFKQGVQSPVEHQAYVERQGYKRFIRIIDLTDPSVPWRFIADPGPVHHVVPSDLFMVRYGSPGLLGFGHEGVIANNLFRLIPKKKIAADFYFQYLSSRKGDIADISGSSTMPAVNFSTLSGLKLVYPPPPEQRAIATALSDVDGLLGGLDRLIAKKHDLKQAAMQQLLTGQTRLPGFHGEWEMKRLGDVATFYKGKGLPKSALKSFGGEPCIHYGELFTRYPETIAEIISRTDASGVTFRSIANDVLMPTSDVTPRGLAKASCIRFDGVILGGDILVIRSDTKLIFGSFLSYLIRYEEDQVLQLVTGSTVFHLYGTDMKKFTFSMPSLAEQTAIAEVLTDMDAELAALEQRREKSRALKQAMMQELLTGRTRLVPFITNIIPFPRTGKARVVKSPFHNWQINEAVVIAMLVRHFGSEQYPLGRRRFTKLSYLLHRHVENIAEGYLKKAAGPYNPAVKYKGPESIGNKNGYIRPYQRGQYSGFIAAGNIAEAEGYFAKWYGNDVLIWLEQFRHKSNDELGLITTVDMTMENLRKMGRFVNLDAIKDFIRSHPEWEAKLSQPIFSDTNITCAINICSHLFELNIKIL